MFRVLFWGSLLATGYTYVGYPLVLAMLARVRPRPWNQAAIEPTVTLLIAAWNEAGVIEAKLENALALDYPKERLKIVVASDGSSDETVTLARKYVDRGVEVLNLPRGGKTATLNRVMPRLDTELVVFSDANVFFEPDAIRKLVRHFADQQLGGVSGDVRLKPDGFSLGQSQGLYYRYERFIQRMESRIGSIIGADGGMYAIRRELFQEVPEHLINDDFIISMQVACQGRRVIYDPEAVAYEDSPINSENEFRRKVRVEHGNFQQLFSGRGVPGTTQPLLLFCYVSHKVMRWTAFVPLTVLAGSSLLLAHRAPLCALAAAAQGVFYALAYAGSRLPGHGGKLTNIPYYFVMENLAAIRGLERVFTGQVQWGTAQTRTRSV